MYILNKNSWADNFLDYYRGLGQYRIDVELYVTLMPIQGLQADQWDLWKVFNYIRELGLKSVIRKAKSRLKESMRNIKYLAFGVGTICDADPNQPLPRGQKVLFIAPCHPECVQRIVLPAALIKPLPRAMFDPGFEKNEIRYVKGDQYLKYLDVQKLAGWSPFSGIDIDEQSVAEIFANIEEILPKVGAALTKKLTIIPNKILESKNPLNPTSASGKQAVIFGYGHYAKTVIMPNLHHSIKIAKVHEIDPTQLGAVEQLPFAIDSAPIPRENDHYDLCCVATYHHLHAPLSIHALNKGCDVISEKPPVTTWKQLKELLEVMEKGKARLFVGYTRRYLPFTNFIREDLGIHANEPLSYYCILNMHRVPPLHWYNWPNSGSQIISNGCHWIDHFLLLNNYSPIKSYDGIEMNNKDLICWVELQNGSTFNMVLTLHGSMRLGYRENIEIRSKDVTVRIRDLSYYTAENNQRVLRKSRINKSSVYIAMYQTISEKIVTGKPGDTKESLERASSLMLSLEDIIRQKRGNHYIR